MEKMVDVKNQILIDEIIKFMNDGIQIKEPDVKVIRQGKTDEFDYIECEYQGHSFGITIENNYIVKIMFYFFSELPIDMQNFWIGDFKIPLRTGNYNHIVGIHKLSEVFQGRQATFIMYKYYDTFKKFYLNMRAVCLMLRSLKHIDYIREMEGKYAKNIIRDRRFVVDRRVRSRTDISKTY